MTEMDPELLKKILKIIHPIVPTPLSHEPKHVAQPEREGPPTPRPVHHEKKAGVRLDRARKLVGGALGGEEKRKALVEIGGLGVLGVPAADHIQAAARARFAGDKSEEGTNKRRLLGDTAHAALEAGGLGILAAPEFKHLGKRASIHGCLDELEKLGESSEISAEDARRSLDRLDTLEKNKPTGKQVARNMAVGAGAGVGIGALGRAIAGAEPTGSRGRLHLAAATTGALGAGAIPLIQQHLARNDEKKQLKKFVEQEYRDHGPDTGATDMQKAAAAEVFDELQALLANPEFLKTASTEEIAELAKLAISMAGIRGGIAGVAGKISPTLNKPVMQVAQGAAHSMQHSPNSFVSGMGDALHHKVQTPGRMAMGALNPIGTAAEVVAQGAGNAASKGMRSVGGAMQSKFGPADATVQQGRAMTPMGRAQNAVGALGGKIQQTFSPGGMGHNIATKVVPRVGEVAGAAAGGMLGAPSLAGALGHAGMSAIGGAAHAVAPAAGAAIEHAGHGFLGHFASDALGGAKQNMLAAGARKMFGGAAGAARQSMLPAAMGH